MTICTPVWLALKLTVYDICFPKFIRDHYAIRFPELEQVIADPWEYISTVKAIGNAEVSSKTLLSSPDLHLTSAVPTGSDQAYNTIDRPPCSWCQHDSFHFQRSALATSRMAGDRTSNGGCVRVEECTGKGKFICV